LFREAGTWNSPPYAYKLRIKTNSMADLISALVFAAIVLVAVGLAWAVIKRLLEFATSLIINSLTAIVLLFLLSFLGITVPLNAVTMILIVVFGLPALAVLILLKMIGWI